MARTNPVRPLLVLGYDGSDDARWALTQTATLMPGARVVVVAVWEITAQVMGRTGLGLGPWMAAMHFEEIDRSVREGAEERAEQGAKFAGSLGLEAEPRAVERCGSVAETLIRIADESGADAILVGARGLGAMRSMLGSVSEAVLRHADRPVIVVPRGTGPQPKKTRATSYR